MSIRSDSHTGTVTYRQTTLRSSIRLSGIGLHTGLEGHVTLEPAPAGSGIQFVSGAVTIPARAVHVVNTRRSTCLGMGETRIDTIEHLLSALYGLGVDNVRICVEGPEIPILDGSALPWVESVIAVGIEELDAEGCALALSDIVVWHEGETWLVAAPADALSLTCVIEFDHPLLGVQAATFPADPDRYAMEIAPARTFGFAAEVDALRAAGLALGGNLDNALVIHDDRFSDSLRVPDECLRHKILDLWGDLSLVAGRLCAAVTAIKPGHRANTAFAARLSEKCRVEPSSIDLKENPLCLI